MLTIYGRKNSACVQLVMWAIGELGLTYERLDYGRGHQTTQTDAYLAMNPMGTVPVLKDGDLCLFESAAILRYLGEKYGDDNFYPTSPDTPAALDTWAEWGRNTFAEAVLTIFQYHFRLAPDTRDPDVLANATIDSAKFATMLDKRLGEGPWLGGEHFSFADIACGFILHRYFTLDWMRPNLPNLDAYNERLQTRDAYVEHAMVNLTD